MNSVVGNISGVSRFGKSKLALWREPLFRCPGNSDWDNARLRVPCFWIDDVSGSISERISIDDVLAEIDSRAQLH